MTKLIKNVITLKKGRIYLFILFSILAYIANAQDVALSQFYSNKVNLNPAYVGVTEYNRLNAFYRNQWSAVSSGISSYGVAYDTYISDLKGGVGIMAKNESVGSLNSSSLDIIYSYYIKANRDLYFSFALQAGVVQRFRKTSSFVFETPELIPSGWNKVYPDFAFGTVVFYKNIYGGFSVDHITQPRTSSESQLIRNYKVHVGYLKYFSSRLLKEQRILSPNILYQINGSQHFLNWGANFQYNYIVGGVWVRNNFALDFDAAIFSIGIKTSSYKISYSYDTNIGKKTFLPLDAHEVSFTILFQKRKKEKKKSIKCPTFLQ